jgi:hypothetical protein
VHRARNLYAKVPERERERVRRAYWRALDEAIDERDAKQRLQALVDELDAVALELLGDGEVGRQDHHVDRMLCEHRFLARQVPSASTMSRAAAPPEYCCWPVIRLPSRTAWGLNRPATMKLVFSSLRASSSIQNGWIFCPVKSSA